MFLDEFDDVYLEFYNQLENRTKECDHLLGEVLYQKFHHEKIIQTNIIH